MPEFRTVSTPGPNSTLVGLRVAIQTAVPENWHSLPWFAVPFRWFELGYELPDVLAAPDRDEELRQAMWDNRNWIGRSDISLPDGIGVVTFP